MVYEQYASEPMLRGQAVAALAEHGPMALAMLSKYAEDKDFQKILAQYGPRVIPAIAQADPARGTLVPQ